MTKTKQQVEADVRSWGFSHVFTWSDRPNAYYAPHSHPGLTTHVILTGELTIAYPANRNIDDAEEEGREKENTNTKTTYGVGERIDVDAGRVHEVWIGEGGCTYVIGE